MKQFVEICSNLKEAVYNLCGINVTKPVDMTVGAYLLNDTHKHTERVYVNTTATLSGTLQTIITGTNVSFNFASIVAINWTSPSSYAVEFGNGYTDLGGNPTFNFVNETDGRYTLKVYRLFRFADNDKYFLIAEIEIDKVGSLLTVASTNPVAINRSITYTSSEGLQSYCNGIPVGSILPINPKLQPKNEWLGQTDANNSSASSSVPLVTPSYSTVRFALAINTIPAPSIQVVPVNTREISIQNMTNSDITVITSQGQQTVLARNNIVLSNPNSLDMNHAIFSGNVTLNYLNSVGGNINGVQPRVAINFKSY